MYELDNAPKQALNGIQLVKRPWPNDFYIFKSNINIIYSKIIALKYTVKYPNTKPDNAIFMIVPYIIFNDYSLILFVLFYLLF